MIKYVSLMIIFATQPVYAENLNVADYYGTWIVADMKLSCIRCDGVPDMIAQQDIGKEIIINQTEFRDIDHIIPNVKLKFVPQSNPVYQYNYNINPLFPGYDIEDKNVFLVFPNAEFEANNDWWGIFTIGEDNNIKVYHNDRVYMLKRKD
ncbi:MAG: hypothetical protein LBI17_01655 [Rickettsiales bacterium]|jgi:hypothetical protein|nr:hypothetical protein [Rickettsiales bacterium]